MLKIYFEDKTIFLIQEFKPHFKENYGLFYRYHDNEELSSILSFFLLVRKIKKLFLFNNNIEELLSHLCHYFTIIEAAGGVVKNTDGKYLFIFRRGKWDLPKGKAEPDEPIETTALREVKEETGIHLLKMDTLRTTTYHIYFENNVPVLKKTYWYDMSTDSKEKPIPQEEEEITDVRWISPRDLAGMKNLTFPSILEIMETL